ncbi:hypothetical protein E1B28_000137 [Marasmius oreades]|uniref:Uncharacterized protein n=1 Tax=Marasmius oreades TaxID=181124 RepID=A0A9P7V0P6_9AGAR|nr:uncharacterized protein E1B28_000137 [Marasmius oreades]KAG7098169.1 hypothetical protein E1B28_000137 [Marasmius oreades]
MTSSCSKATRSPGKGQSNKRGKKGVGISGNRRKRGASRVYTTSGSTLAISNRPEPTREAAGVHAEDVEDGIDRNGGEEGLNKNDNDNPLDASITKSPNETTVNASQTHLGNTLPQNTPPLHLPVASVQQNRALMPTSALPQRQTSLAPSSSSQMLPSAAPLSQVQHSVIPQCPQYHHTIPPSASWTNPRPPVHTQLQPQQQPQFSLEQVQTFFAILAAFGIYLQFRPPPSQAQVIGTGVAHWHLPPASHGGQGAHAGGSTVTTPAPAPQSTVSTHPGLFVGSVPQAPVQALPTPGLVVPPSQTSLGSQSYYHYHHPAPPPPPLPSTSIQILPSVAPSSVLWTYPPAPPPPPLQIHYSGFQTMSELHVPVPVPVPVPVYPSPQLQRQQPQFSVEQLEVQAFLVMRAVFASVFRPLQVQVQVQVQAQAQAQATSTGVALAHPSPQAGQPGAANPGGTASTPRG